MEPKRQKAISYRRFSSKKQQKGDSICRQTEAARRYATAHDLELDESFTFEDLGVSAQHSRHIEEGQLGKLIAAIDEGYIEQGTVILIESLDRLSRDKVMTALQHLNQILTRGVSIVTFVTAHQTKCIELSACSHWS